jgi:superfamily I DNA/RNA helicase
MHGLITSWGFSATAYHSDLPVPVKLKRYIVTTFMSAKGLEFDTVIIPRMNFYRDPETDPGTRIREEMYVACTRARSRLYIYRDLAHPQYDPIAGFDPSTYDTPTTEESAAAGHIAM